jgi:hypothetical protein
MGYDYARWLRGFASLDEVVAYVFSSPRIHNGFMTADSECTKARRREAKDRVQWIAIMKWYTEHQSQFPSLDQLPDPVPLTIEAKIAYVEKHFPGSNLRAQYEAVQKRLQDSAAARNKFSGSHIQALFPELQGRTFGALMDLWTRQWPTKEEQIQYILTHDVEHLTALACEVRSKLVL